MVAKHLDKLQKEKEASAMQALSALLPKLRPAVPAVALQECDWDAGRALDTLRQFQAAKAAELDAMQAEWQQRLAAVAPAAAGDGSGSDVGRGDASESGSASGSSEDERSRKRQKRGSKNKRSGKDGEAGRKEKKRRKKKGKEHEKEKERKRKHGDKEAKHRRDDEKRKKEKREPGAPHVDEQYGRYGLVRETDAYAKRPEFALWALEVKNIDVDVLPKFEERELFKTYMEDFNTATLPHKKYYDLEAHEKRRAAKAAAHGGGGGGEERVAFDDEAERRKELEAQRRREQAERLAAAYQELKTTGKAEEMRQQELMRAKMALAYRTGDQREALRLAERLKPDDMKAPAEATRPPRAPASGT